ncbi:hypothetical protein PAPHI01_1740 [Pancytospora philotis]|nr:hypothetical protein PAPHI01_1740 [Pancytospora philotis]
MNLLLGPLLLLIAFLFSGIDTRTLTARDGRHGYRYRHHARPRYQDVYGRVESTGPVKYGDVHPRDYIVPDVEKNLCQDLQKCFLPSQRSTDDDTPRSITVADLKKTCDKNFHAHIKTEDVVYDYADGNNEDNKNGVVICREGRHAPVKPAEESSLVADFLTNVFSLFTDTLSDKPVGSAVLEFQSREFDEVHEQRYSAAVGNPKIAYEDGSAPERPLYRYYFADQQFTTFLEKMEQNSSPKARRFIPLYDFYEVRAAVRAGKSYRELSHKMKLKWAMLVFSKFTLRLYAERDAFSGILKLGQSDAKTPEDLAEALHSYFADVYESESCRQIARSIAEAYTKFDLFELAYLQCTGDAPYLIEEHNGQPRNIRLDHRLTNQVPAFIVDTLTILRAWQESDDAKVTARALEKAEAEITEFYENNTDKSNGECQ